MKNVFLLAAVWSVLGTSTLIAQDVLFQDDDLTITQFNYTNKKAYSEEYLEYTTEDGYVTTDYYNSKETRVYTYDRNMQRIESEVTEQEGFIPAGYIPRDYFTVNDQKYVLATSANKDTKRSEYHILKKDVISQTYKHFIDPVSVLEGETEYFSQILQTVPRVTVSADEKKILVAHMMKHQGSAAVFRLVTLNADFQVEESHDIAFNKTGVFNVLGLDWKTASTRVRHVDIFHITNSGVVYTIGKLGGTSIFEQHQLCEIRGGNYAVVSPQVPGASKTIVHGLANAQGSKNTYLTGIADMGGRKWSPFIIKLNGTDKLQTIPIHFTNQTMGEAMNFPQAKIDKIEAAGKNVSMFPPHVKFLSEEENGDIFIIHEIDYFAADKYHTLGAFCARVSADGQVLDASTIRKSQVGTKYWQGMWFFQKGDKIIGFYNDHIANAEANFDLPVMKTLERGDPVVVKVVVNKRDATLLSQEIIWDTKDDERTLLPIDMGIPEKWYDNKFIDIIHSGSEAATVVFDFH
jgi:hypothetical protein